MKYHVHDFIRFKPSTIPYQDGYRTGILIRVGHKNLTALPDGASLSVKVHNHEIALDKSRAAPYEDRS